MAYDPNEQFETQPGLGSQLRIFPTSQQPKTFAAGTGTIANGTPVAFNTATKLWVVWTNGGVDGTGTIKGFLNVHEVEGEHTLVVGSETLANVMLTGRIHRDDVVLPAGELQADLDAALAGGGVRELGIIVEGLAKFR